MITNRRSTTPVWPALLGVAVLPWAAAWLITLAEGAILRHRDQAVQQVVRDLFTAPNLLVPVIVFAAWLGMNQFLRKGLTLASPHQHWTAGGWFAFAALTAQAVLALLWGGIDAVAYQVLWTIFSGYAVLVFLAGAYTWRRNQAPYPRQNGFHCSDETRDPPGAPGHRIEIQP